MNGFNINNLVAESAVIASGLESDDFLVFSLLLHLFGCYLKLYQIYPGFFFFNHHFKVILIIVASFLFLIVILSQFYSVELPSC